MTDIDVIVPVGVRTDDLAALHRRRSEALRAAGYRASFVYVVDGEIPQARETLAALARASDDARVIQLSRRFGETAAVLAGFASTKTEQLMILPAFEQPFFLEAFRTKPPMTRLLERMPVSIVLNRQTGLLGAAVYAATLVG